MSVLAGIVEENTYSVNVFRMKHSERGKRVRDNSFFPKTLEVIGKNCKLQYVVACQNIDMNITYTTRHGFRGGRRGASPLVFAPNSLKSPLNWPKYA